MSEPETTLAHSAGVAVALAMAAGMIAQSLARHLRLPGIVLLLAAGVLLGPDLLGLIDPADLGTALPVLVNLAVAVVLFEGGMNLNMKRLRRQALIIRRLLTAQTERIRMPLNENADNPTEQNRILSPDEMYSLMSWINCMEPGDGVDSPIRYDCTANADNNGEW